MVGRTILIHGLFESNDSKVYTGVTAFTCADGATLVITQASGNTTIDLRTIQSFTVVPAATQFQPGDAPSDRPPGT